MTEPQSSYVIWQARNTTRTATEVIQKLVLRRMFKSDIM